LQKSLALIHHPKKLLRLHSEGKDHEAIFVEERPVLRHLGQSAMTIIVFNEIFPPPVPDFFIALLPLSIPFPAFPRLSWHFPLSLISTIISTLDETLLCAVSTDHPSSHLLPLFLEEQQNLPKKEKD